MSTLTKMAVLPMPMVDRLAKYDKDLQHITNLIQADYKRDKILSSNSSNPMSNYLAYNENQSKIEREKEALFGNRQLIPTLRNSVQHVSHAELAETGVHSRAKPTNLPYVRPRSPDREIVRPQPPRVPPIQQPPLPAVEEPPQQEIVTQHDDDDEQSQETTPTNQNPDESMAESETSFTSAKDGNLSFDSQRRYQNAKLMKKTIAEIVPQDYLSFDENGAVHIERGQVGNSNIDAILNYLTTPNAQYVAGAMSVLEALYKVPNFNATMVENRRALERFRSKYKNQLPELFSPRELQSGSNIGGARLPRKFICVDQLPCDLE